MAGLSWWTTISTAELLRLRRRLVQHVKIQFGSTLKAELEDVVQHAFTVLFRHRGSVNADNDGLYRYLKTVSRRAALDWIKGAKRRQDHLRETIAKHRGHALKLPIPGIPPEELREQSEKIWRIFCALDDLDRLVVWSHVVDGKSIRAVSRDLDLNWHRVAGIIDETLRLVRKQFTS